MYDNYNEYQQRMKKEKQQLVRHRGKQQMNSPINKESFMSPPSKQCAMNSPNKENYIGSANQALSPIVNYALQSPLGNYQSPVRTTSSEALQCLRSNKSKEPLQENANEAMLFSGLSKDGKYRVESRALEGAELERAVEQQKKTALRAMLASGREKGKAPQFQSSRVSSKANGVVKAYAINTHSGITRNYNEDRVSVTLNIKKQGKRAQFFAIYDGHGGSHCCDYLKDTLHQLVISHSDFPGDPRKALHQAIQQAQVNYCDAVRAKQSRGQGLEKSGSCALILLLVEDCCYIANVGDSRAILSTENGRVAFNLSRDHRPLELRQQQRILSRGGKVYRTEMNRILAKKEDKAEKIVGPLRVYPGRLSVTRTLGDIQAKDPQFGGMRGVISAEPEIRKFRLTGKQDFILLCCDGALERMQSMQVVEAAWSAMKKQGSVHEQAGKGVDAVLRESMRRKSSDNLTAIMICLSELTPTHAS